MKWFFGLYPGDRVLINGSYHYISEFFPKINILFNSKYLIKKNSLYKKVEELGFRELFSIYEADLFLDSGSYFYYRYNELPPKISTLIKRYDFVNPDYVAHNDIPVAFLNTQNHNIKKLLRKNLWNAVDFLKITRDRDYISVGIAQGINEIDYLRQIKELYHIGYNYIGIGGIARKSTKVIRKFLSYVSDFVKKNKIKLHLFGIGRLDIIKDAPIYSFDNTSPVQDAHRDSIGKVSYYYWLTNKKSIKKLSLFDINNGLIEFNENCYCDMCEIFQEEIFQTGKAPRNRARSYHNAYIYQKCLDLNVCQHNI